MCMPPTGAVVPALPPELWSLIVQHGQAAVIQLRWRRYSLYGHARRKTWPRVKSVLRAANAWPGLWRYEMVRREWRMEPESWESACTLFRDLDVGRLEEEARDGHWGASILCVPPTRTASIREKAL